MWVGDVRLKALGCLKAFVAASFAGVVILAGCGKGYPKVESPKSPPVVEASGNDQLSKGRVGIKKSQLNRDLLLIANMRSVSSKPSWMSFQPKIVRFQRAGKVISLNERLVDRVYEEIASPDDGVLIQTFDIIEENADMVFVNWKFGFKWLPETSDDESDHETPNNAVEVVSSFNTKMESLGDTFFSEQRVRLRVPKITNDKEIVYQEPVFNLYIKMRPYEVNKSFQTRESRMDQGFGLFTIKRIRQALDKTYELITRWDIEKKPIQVLLSAAIPNEYVPAVSEGLQYWNRVLGKDLIQIQTGADPTTELREGQVIVHWVNWDDAGFAYADMQSDPVTGETLQGQIFMTSSWVRMADLDQKAQVKMADNEVSNLMGVRLGGFQPSRSCLRRIPRDLLKMNNGADHLSLENIGHVLRVVIAHEMGHVLGLRHNFAASFISQVEPKDIQNAWLDFSHTGTVRPVATADSVMDYESTFDTFLLGAAIRKQTLPYDEKVIKWAYQGEKSNPLVFCTDENLDKLIGCQMFDSTRSPLVMSLTEAMIDMRESIGLNFQKILSKVFPKGVDRREVHEVLNDFEFKFATGEIPIRKFFTDKKTVVEYILQDSWKEEKSVELSEERIKKLSQEVGYFAGVLKSLAVLDDDFKIKHSDYEAMLESGLGGLALEGEHYLNQKYALSPSELDEIKEYFKHEFSGLPIKRLERVLDQLSPGKSLSSGPKSKSVTVKYALTSLNGPQKSVFETLKALIFLGDRSNSEWKGGQLLVPTRTYGFQTLERALNFYSNELFPDDATTPSRREIIRLLKEELQPLFVGSTYEGKILKMNSKELHKAFDSLATEKFQDWVHGNLAILQVLEVFERNDKSKDLPK